MTDLASWALADFSHGGRTFPTYRTGAGPGVVIVHEIPGITPAVLAFAGDVVGAGFTVGVDRVLDFLRRRLLQPAPG